MWWEFLNVGACGIGAAFLASLFFTYNWNLNPLLWRVFSPKAITIGPGDHHALIMLMLGIVFFVSVRLGVDPLLTAFGVYLAIEGYEAEWYVTYIITKAVYHGAFQWSWMAVTLLIVPVFFMYSIMFGFPWKFMLFMVPMFVGWFLLGFPVTQDFPGYTTYYFSLQVNALEITTHLWSCVGFFFFIWPRLRKSTVKINTQWWTGFK